MAAFAIKASAVLCTGAMGIIGRPRRALRTICPFPRRGSKKKGTVPPSGETGGASRRRWPPSAPSFPSRRRPLQQALARPDDRELDRLRGDGKSLVALAHHSEG